MSHGEKDFYYDHMPVYTGGNVYFNGAQPCDTEENYRVDTEHTVWWQLKETDGRMTLETNLYEFMPELETPFISTEVLGEALEHPFSSIMIIWESTGASILCLGLLKAKKLWGRFYFKIE